MLEKINTNKSKKKRKFILTRLVELEYLPPIMDDATEEQKVIYNQIWDLNFDFWEEVKEKNGWIPRNKLTQEEESLRDKRTKARSYLRDYNYLPPYGEELTEEQQNIINQLEGNDFTFLEEVKTNNRDAQKIVNVKKSKQVLSGDYIPMKYDISGHSKSEIRKMEEYTITSEPKNVFQRLRLLQILPPIGQEFNESQQVIVDDVNENWFGKPKNFFISKYIGFSTPESRLFYRLYRSHRDEGFRFNITVDDIVIPERCPLLDIPLSTDPKDKDEPNYYTGDRIDSSKGVVKGNIQVISLRANKMKNKATELELLTFATNGLKLLKDV